MLTFICTFKFDIIILNKMNNVDFAFIVHSRTAEDFKRKYRILHWFPDAFIDFITLRLKPILVSRSEERRVGKECRL